MTSDQVREGQGIAEIVCLQNRYNPAHRGDDAPIDVLSEQGIAYVPFFPPGGFNRLQSDILNRVAARLGATPMQTALAWFLRRSPDILLIPGTSPVAHLRENLAAADPELPKGRTSRTERHLQRGDVSLSRLTGGKNETEREPPR